MKLRLRNLFGGRAGRPAARNSARPRLGVQQLDDRVVPSTIPVTYHGGPLIAHANVSNVFYGQNWGTDDPTGTIRHSMIDFQKEIITSPYMAQLGEYGVGRGSVGNAYVPEFTGPTRGGTVTEDQIQNMLRSEILSGRVPFPTEQQLYFVYLSPGVTSAFDRDHNYAGHHGSFAFLPGILNSPVHYAVIPDTNFSSVAGLTAVSSHELAEAVTDPDAKGGWYDISGNEIGDGLEGQNANFVVGNHAWVVQKEWSNYFGKGIVADGSKAAMLNAPAGGLLAAAYFNFLSSTIWNNNGWITTDYFAQAWSDGLFYHNFTTAAGDLSGWFTIM
jgi:hypothetical protein